MAMLQRLRASHRLIASPESVRSPGSRDATVLLANDRSYAFVDVINPGDTARSVGPFRAALAQGIVDVPPVSVAPRSARLIPVGLSGRPSILPHGPATATPPPFYDDEARLLRSGSLRVAIAPRAGARIAELGDGKDNVATSIGLLAMPSLRCRRRRRATILQHTRIHWPPAPSTALTSATLSRGKQRITVNMMHRISQPAAAASSSNSLSRKERLRCAKRSLRGIRPRQRGSLAFPDSHGPIPTPFCGLKVATPWASSIKIALRRCAGLMRTSLRWTYAKVAAPNSLP